jgi:uncharacterized protein (TIGR04255 family)
MQRSRPPLKLHDGPLVLALAQVRIAAVLQMQTFIPEIQERLRNAGYPRYSESQMQEIVLGPAAAATTGAVMTKWTFADKDGTKAVVIAPDFVTFEAANYDTFESFSEELGSVLSLVGEVAKIALAERLGLRYVDCIRAGDDDRIEDYVVPGLAGIELSPVGAQRSRSVFVVQGTTASGQYIVRFSRNSGAFALPADLQPADVTINPPDGAGEYALLDVDHFSTQTREYRPEVLLDLFWQLHDVSEGIFREAVTSHALRAWKMEELEEVPQ